MISPSLCLALRGQESHVSPLLIRGFVEDIYNELSISDGNASFAFDPALGTLLVQYGAMKGQGPGGINLRLLSSDGREISEGWYFGVEESDLTKAIYFNLNPDLYTVIVENETGYWLGATTIVVDYWTTSFARLGSPIRYREDH